MFIATLKVSNAAVQVYAYCAAGLSTAVQVAMRNRVL